MFKKIISFVGVCAVALSMTACSRVQPIENQQNQFVPTGLTQTQVKNAIVVAANSKGWVTSETSPGLIYASINVRDHAAQVQIPYSSKTYSIVYVSSSRLHADAQGEIHRNYNKWVTLLNAKIQAQLRATPVQGTAKHSTATKPKAKTTAQSSAVVKTQTTTTTVAQPTTTVQSVVAVPSATK